MFSPRFLNLVSHVALRLFHPRARLSRQPLPGVQTTILTRATTSPTRTTTPATRTTKVQNSNWMQKTRHSRVQRRSRTVTTPTVPILLHSQSTLQVRDFPRFFPFNTLNITISLEPGLLTQAKPPCVVENPRLSGDAIRARPNVGVCIAEPRSFPRDGTAVSFHLSRSLLTPTTGLGCRGPPNPHRLRRAADASHPKQNFFSTRIPRRTSRQFRPPSAFDVY